MGSWKHQGHAIRRRIGAPSSTFGAAMAQNDDMSAAVAAGNQQGRQVMGNSVASMALREQHTFAHPELLRAKYQMKLSDPALVPGVSPRSAMDAHRLGSRYAISVRTEAPGLPEAAATQANGKVVPSVVQRSADSFGQGARS